MTKKQPPQKQNKALQTAHKKIIIQAVIAIQAIVITVALVFGMSAAWYTNVLQTSGLQFEAAAWGFDGEVLIADDPIQASPGQSGLIGLRVSNKGADIVDVAVRVSKEQMEVPMRQRLYFYVDTATTREGETVDRVYINSRDSYTYTVLSHSELVLTQERANDVLLKWQWVYDMQGYYFLGTVTKSKTAEDTDVILADVEDYLRPVEYDLDHSTFRDGVLDKVGEQTLEQFLEELSGKDGYAGGITPTDMPGYYQVDVDENGYGIWVYLCNWSEIQQATTYDSQLGKAAADALQDENLQPLQFVARLMVVGQMGQSEYTEIATAEELIEQLSSGGLLLLEDDIQLTEPLTVGSGEKRVLNLNSHTITGPEGQPLFRLTDRSDLILMNGDLVAQSPGEDIFLLSNSTLTLSNVQLSGEADDAIYVTDEDGKTDSCVRLFDCQVNTDGCSVYVRGNGERSEGKTQVIVENCILESNYITIMGNGTSAYWGTDIQIYNSQLKGYYSALYLPQSESVTRLTDCTLEGGTGIAIKGGDLEIVNCRVAGTMESSEPKVEGSGYTDTGDALYVDCSYGYPIHISITGDAEKNVFSSVYAQAVRVFVPEGGKHCASVTVTGGYFSTDVSPFLPEGFVYDPDSGKVTQATAQEGAENG